MKDVTWYKNMFERIFKGSFGEKVEYLV